MNLGEARALVRLYINEPKAAAWTDAQLNGLIQNANLSVFQTLVAQTPDIFTAVNQFSVASGTRIVDFSAEAQLYLPILKMGPAVQVLGVAASKQKAVSTPQLAPGLDCKILTPATRVLDLIVDSPQYMQTTSTLALPEYPTYYKIINNRQILLSPETQQQFYLWIWFVPSLVQPTADNNVLLAAGSSEGTTTWTIAADNDTYDELVPLLAAIKAKTTVGGDASQLVALYKDRLDTIKDLLRMSLERQTPTRIVGTKTARN